MTKVGSVLRILYIYDGNWPKGATRVAKQTRSLSRRHSVVLACRNEDREPRIHEEAWMTVFRLPAIGPRLLNQAINFPYFFNPVWIWHLFETARATRAECIIVADLPLAPTALFVGGALQIPIFYDLAEVYPEFIKSQWAFGEMRWTDHFVRNPSVAERLEQFVVTRVDGLFVVSEESRRRLLEKGVEPGRVTLVGNTPENPEAYVPSGATPPGMNGLERRTVLLFVGILIGDRGLATAIRAMAFLRHDYPEALLVIVGDGPDRARLEDLAKSLDLEEFVVFLGWQPHETLPDYYARGNIGLLPFDDGQHIRITLANKLFDYMAAGLPVIATDLPPMRRVIEECGSGVLVPPEDPKSLAQAAARMISEPAISVAMGTSGQEAVWQKYSWSHDEERLWAAVEKATRPVGGSVKGPDAPHVDTRSMLGS